MHAHESDSANQEHADSTVKKPGIEPAERLLRLQRSVGNTTVARMLADDEQTQGAEPFLVHDVLRAPGAPLDDSARQEMEARLGADFSTVRVHTDATAQRSAAEIGARAYTSGEHVVIGSGGADPHTLAHELTHVIQQRQGPVAGIDTGTGLSVSDPTDQFERAAEANATRAMSIPVLENEGVAVQRTIETRSNTTAIPGTITKSRLAIPPVHPTGTAFVDHVYNTYRNYRLGISNPWNANFAVLEYMDLSNNTVKYSYLYNVPTAQHSEEAILATLYSTQYRPIAFFTDNSPCSNCESLIMDSVRSRARGYDVPVYYIADYAADNANVRHGQIRAWWQ